MAGNDDTTSLEFYAPWPNFGKALNQQWGEIRTDIAHLAPLVRGIGLDASGDFSTLDSKESLAMQAFELGEDGWHNKIRHYWNKTKARVEIQSNIPPGTTDVPNWYTVWAVDDDGAVTAITSTTTASNLGTGKDVFKSKEAVDLQFRSLKGSGVLSITQNSLDLTFVSTAEANTASSAGGTSLIKDKSGVDLPFKGLVAGSNMQFQIGDDSITLESTSQIVEFYGIAVMYDDDSKTYPEVHVLKVNVKDFYLTQKKSNPSAKGVVINLRGDVFDSNAYVKRAGDSMTGALLHADGTAAAPTVSFSGDTNTGITRLAADDMALVSGGVSVLRALTDRVYLPKNLQIMADGTAAAPDIYFFPDTDTGIFQQGLDSIAFTTGGKRAGYFSQNQDFYVTGRLLVGDGTRAKPAIAFASDPEGLGITDGPDPGKLDFVTAGALRLQISDTQITPTLGIRPNQAGSSSDVHYGFNTEDGTGLYLKTTNQLGFATNDVLAGYFDANQNLFVTQTLSAHKGNFNKSMNAPTGTFYTAITVGNDAPGDSILEFYDESTLKYTVGFDNSADELILSRGPLDGTNDEIRIQTNNVIIKNLDIDRTGSFGRIEAGPSLFYTQAISDQSALTVDGNITLTRGQILMPDGSGSVPPLSFASDTNSGLFLNSAGVMRFVTGGGKRLEVTNGYVLFTNKLRLSATNSLTELAIQFNDDTNTGLYQETDGDDDIDFASGGVHAATIGTDGLTVVKDVMAGRVESGPSVFYIQDEGTSALTLSPGSAAKPSIVATIDADSGIYWTGASTVISANAANIMQWDSGACLAFKPVRLDDDSTAVAPALAFRDDINTGLYQTVNAGNDLSFATDGVRAGFFDDKQNLHVTNTMESDRVLAEHGTFYASLEVGTFVQGHVKPFIALSKTSASQDDIGGAEPAIELIRWDVQDHIDSIFTHSTSTNSSRITVTETGRYELYAMVSGTTDSNDRLNVVGGYAINGGTRTQKGGLGSYARGSAFGDKARPSIRTEINLVADEYVEFQTQVLHNDSSNTCLTDDDECELIMRKIS